MNSYCTSWWSLLFTTNYSTQWGWKAELALLADLQWMVYPYKWLPISCRSGADHWKLSPQLRLASSEQWCWFGGRGIL